MSADEKPPAPCRVCDRGPADDAGATWQDETCPGCGRYRIAEERSLLSFRDAMQSLVPKGQRRVGAEKALAARERRRKA